MTFEELYHHHKSRVYNLALHYVQNVEDAQEITQDVFVSAFHAMDSFEGRASISTWLYRITINKSLDWIKSRKRKRRFAFLTSLFAENSPVLKHDLPDFNHPGVLLERKESMETLFGWINSLPDNQKTVLILQKIEQKTQSEVAEIMNISPKAVESLMQRAKVNLSKKMNQSEGLPANHRPTKNEKP